MNNPCLYKRANKVQRHDAEQMIRKFAHKLQWRLEGGDTLLDVGSGCGDVLMDFVYTIMPKNFGKIVGTDVSGQMIEFAQNVYGTYEKCDFKVLDIGREEDLPQDLKGQYDHVTSFYCLHWITNKRQALRNIFNLLRAEGGDCLLVFLAAHPVYDAYRLLGKSRKWSCYMNDVDKYLVPLDYTEDAQIEISRILQEVGFSHAQVEVMQREYVYNSLESCTDNFRAVNPFLDRIPILEQENYMTELVSTFASFGFRELHATKKSEFIFRLPYKLVVVYAKKLPIKISDC